jgi:hypothetical protein
MVIEPIATQRFGDGVFPVTRLYRHVFRGM